MASINMYHMMDGSGVGGCGGCGGGGLFLWGAYKAVESIENALPVIVDTVNATGAAIGEAINAIPGAVQGFVAFVDGAYNTMARAYSDAKDWVNSLTNSGDAGTPPDPNQIKHWYKSIKDCPNYPEGFRRVQDGLHKVKITDTGGLYEQLRAIDPGKWYKVYQNGFDKWGDKITLHYFQSQSGKIFDLWVKSGWYPGG